MFVLVLLAVAASSPSLQTSSQEVKTQELIYLNDNSRSMAGSAPNISIDGVSVSERTLASGNSSRINSALRGYLEPDTSYLIRSDFQASGDFQQVFEEFKRQNSTINILRTDLKPEYSVSIEGPDLTVPGAKNRFDVKVSSTESDAKQVSVTIDGEEVRSEETQTGYTVEKEFQEKGYHRIEVSVEVDDEYSENNKYYKTVKTVEKPDILVVGSRGQLGTELSEFFDVDYAQTVPEDLSSYYSVILKKKLEDTSSLQSYLIEGNGLIYTGDGEMDILPVQETERQDDTENPAVVLAVDISFGLGGDCQAWLDPDTQTVCIERSSTGGSIDNSRDFAYNLISATRENRPGARMGSLLYNDGYLPLSNPKPLRINADEMMSKISRINPQASAFHNIGVTKSRDMLGESGNIILVTDGHYPSSGGVYGPGPTEIAESDVTQSEYENNLVKLAENLPDKIKLFTVAVGTDKNQDFLSELAKAGGGVPYGSVDEFYSNPPTFIGGGGTGSSEALTVINSEHFITQDTEDLKVATSQFDSVKPKSSADLLLSSTSGKPALTSWRYGLGRVASFSTSNDDLNSILRQEPQLVARSVSWASGNPQRKDNRTVTISSSRQGQEVSIKADFPLEGLTRSSANTYRATTGPESLGFHEFQGNTFSYNYREEVQNLGYKEDVIESAVESTGGKIVAPSNVGYLKSTIPVKTSEINSEESLSNYFIALALIVFLIQVGFRKRKGLI